MTTMNVSLQEFKLKPGTYLNAASKGETIQVMVKGQVRAVVTPPKPAASRKSGLPKLTPAAMLEPILTRRRPRITGVSVADMVLEDRG
jgi:antitoxin (DNA-binding transcriptional repressor) of toxin-antitoxin stability system